MGQYLLAKVDGMFGLCVWQCLLSDLCFLTYSLPLSSHFFRLTVYEMAETMLCVSVSELKSIGI